MLQIFLLTELFLLSSLCLIWVDSPENTFLFLINFKNFVYKNKKRRIIFLILNILTLVLNIFFPVSPGPVLLGDLLVCINLVFLLFHFVILFKKDNFKDEINKKNTLAFFTLGVLILHLILPNFVLL